MNNNTEFALFMSFMILIFFLCYLKLKRINNPKKAKRMTPKDFNVDMFDRLNKEKTKEGK